VVVVVVVVSSVYQRRLNLATGITQIQPQKGQMQSPMFGYQTIPSYSNSHRSSLPLTRSCATIIAAVWCFLYYSCHLKRRTLKSRIPSPKILMMSYS